MEVKASAPGKVILFGEHAVVYGKPAIAVAIDKRAIVTIKKNKEDVISVNIDKLGVHADINPLNYTISLKRGESGILKYVIESLKMVHDGSPITVDIDLEIPIGAGLGSSAAVTVATLSAASKYNDNKISLEKISKYAHQVELNVQKSASPIDTTISTYGGAVYLSENAEEIKSIDIPLNFPLIISYTPRRGNTGELVEKVKIRKELYPQIINPLIDSMGILTNTALESILREDYATVAELMNINHGFLDSLGVNTQELSNMVYTARKAGALGSKITGAGGGGSIVAYCPENHSKVLSALQNIEDAITVNISQKGVEYIN
ncbi:MAG: mevalonate kinase [Methanomicrobiales archaeon]